MVRSDAPMHNSCRPNRQIAISKKDRLKIYIRDRLVCQLCDSPVDLTLPTTDRWAATLDHIVPYSLGGSDDESNLRLAHRSCNSRRGAPLDAAEAAA
ncbi:HNH endonuclease signature motif containing protein [Mycolicibacterium fortuitum]|uniref:HNH endonuclease n=1 Tax=Mycolicibacterium fortuitum TaxID=1766 RepID=UPI003013E80C